MGIVLTREWNRRVANKPWESPITPGSTEDPESIFISVLGDATEIGTDHQAYFTTASRHDAIEKILDYYGKQDPTGNLVNTLETDKMAYHFSGRPETRVQLLYAVPYGQVKNLPCKDIFNQTQSEHTQLYSTSTMGSKINALAGLFEKYQNQYKFYPGRVSPPLSFTRYLNRMRLAYEKIVEFIGFNGIEYRDSEDDSVQINFDEDYQILNIIVTQEGIEKHLIRGNNFYFRERQELRNPVTNRLLYNLSAIYSLRRGETTWSDFVDSYIKTPSANYAGLPQGNIEYSGLSQTPKAAELIANAQDDINKLFMSPKTTNAAEIALQNQANQLAMINDAFSEKSENIATGLQEVATKLSEVEKKVQGGVNLVRKYINMFGINHLIEAAIECFTLKTGIPVPLPGAIANPWKKPNPPVILEIPKMYPVKLPKINIGQALSDEILKGLKKAGMDAVIGMLQVLAEVILEACREQDKDQIGNSPPLPSIINDYPSADQAFKDGPEGRGAMAGMIMCLSDYGINKSDSDEFFMRLSNNVSPQEICDALNGAPSPAFLEVVYNLNMMSDSGDTVRQAFIYLSPTGASYLMQDTVIDFFVCMGRLVSPDFCVAAYTPTIVTFSENADVCEIEEMFVERVPNETLNQLVAAYENLDDLIPPSPNMNPGCGIVPPLAEMPALNHSVTTMFNTVMEMPKVSFAEDITGLQDIMLVPSTAVDQGKQDLIDEIQKQLDDAGRTDLKKNDSDDDGEKFMKDLFGQDVANLMSGIPGFNAVKGAATNALSDQISSLQAGMNYDINPAYEAQMGGIENRIEIPWGTWPPAGLIDIDEINQHAYFWIGGDTKAFYYAPFSSVAGSVSSTGAPLNSIAIESLGSSAPSIDGIALGAPFRGEARTTYGSTPFADAIAAPFDAAAAIYIETTVDSSTGQIIDTVVSSPPAHTLTDMRRHLQKLWFPANLSAMNLIASQVTKSRFFDVEEFKKLIMVPVPCATGPRETYGDLSGFEDILNEAKEQFNDAASGCQEEKPCSLGPVEDALIFALTSAYLQITILEQVVKNIWLIDAYGFNDVGTNDKIMSTIIGAITSNLAEPAFKGALDLLYAGSVLHVNKLRQRNDIDFPALTGHLPDPTQDPALGLKVQIPSDVVAAFESPEGTFKNILRGGATNFGYPTALKVAVYSLEYMIKTRLENMADAIGEVFGQTSTNVMEQYLYNGIPVIDVLDGSFQWTLISDQGIERTRLQPDTSIQLWSGAPPFEPLVMSAASILGTSGPTSPIWNYDGLPEEERQDVSKNGAVVLEKYVKFDFDLNLYKDLRDSIHEVDVAVYTQIKDAVEKLVGLELVGTNDLETGMPYQVPANNGAPSTGGTMTLTVSQEKFNELYGLFAMPDRIGSLTETLETISPANLAGAQAVLQEIIDEQDRLSLSNIEVTYYYDYMHLGSMGNSTWLYYKGLMKGPLNEQNYEAVRYWLNELSDGQLGPAATGITGFWRADGIRFNQMTGPENVSSIASVIIGAPGMGHSHWTTVHNNTSVWHGYFPSGDSTDDMGTTRRDGYRTGFSYEGFNHRIALFSKDNDDRVAFMPYISNAEYPPTQTVQPDIYSYDEAISRGAIDWNNFPEITNTATQVQSFIHQARKTYPSVLTWPRTKGLADGSARPNQYVPAYLADTNGRVSLAGGPYIHDQRKLYEETARALGSGPGNATFQDSPYDSLGAQGALNGQVTKIQVNTNLFGSLGAEALATGAGNAGLKDIPLSVYQDEMARLETARSLQVDVIDALSGPIIARDLLTNLVTNIRIGGRIAYYSPVMNKDPQDPYRVFLQTISDRLGYGKPWETPPPTTVTVSTPAPTQLETFFKTRSGYLVQTPDGYVFSTQLGMMSEPVILADFSRASMEAKQPLTGFPSVEVAQRSSTTGEPLYDSQGLPVVQTVDTRPNIQGISGLENYGQNIFEAYKRDLYAEITADPDFVEFFDQIISIKDLVSLLFLYGINLSNALQSGQGPENDFKRLFTDTKAALRTCLGGAFNAADYCYVDPDAKSASEKKQEALLGLAQAGLGPLVQLGSSFILKMLIQTPLRILKGLAEVADPHVIVGKIIKDQTGHIIRQVEPYWPGAELPLPCPPDDAPDWTFDMANNINSLEGILEPTFVEFLQKHVNTVDRFAKWPKALRMEVSDRGVNMIGKMPLLFLPPFIFGIVYILLDLMDKDMLSFRDTSEAPPLCPAPLEITTVTVNGRQVECVKPPEPPPKVIEPCDPGGVQPDTCAPDTGPVTTCDD